MREFVQRFSKDLKAVPADIFSYRFKMDYPVNNLLDNLHSLPVKAALQALWILRNLSILKEDDVAYPRLPKAFDAKEFKEIKPTLKQLAEIMWNRQPQHPVKYSDDMGGTETQWGKFNLVPVSRKADKTLAAYIHDYMRRTFAIRAVVIALLSTVVRPSLEKVKKENRVLYYKHLLAWICSTKKRADGMKALLHSEKKLVCEIEHIMPGISAHHGAIIDALFRLPPEIADSAVSPMLQQLQSVRVEAKDNDKTRFSNERKRALRKILAQIKKPDKTFEAIEKVIQSFLQAEMVLLLIVERYSDLVELGTQRLEHIAQVARDYLISIQKSNASSQKGLTESESRQLKQFYRDGLITLKSSHSDWVRNFFSIYFSAREGNDTALFEMLYQLWFVQHKLEASDAWLKTIAKDNFNDGAVEITPYETVRIVLHACLVPPEHWSALYYSIYSQLVSEYLTVARNSDVKQSEISENDTRFMQQSFPIDFRYQLHWLLQQYKDLNHDASSDSNDAKRMEEPHHAFPMPCSPTKPEDITEILCALRQEHRVALYRILAHKRRRGHPPIALLLSQNREGREILAANNGQIARMISAEDLNYINTEGRLSKESVALRLARTFRGRKILAANNYQIARMISATVLNQVMATGDFAGESVALWLAKKDPEHKILAANDYRLVMMIDKKSLCYVPTAGYFAGESIALWLAKKGEGCKLLAANDYRLIKMIDNEHLCHVPTTGHFEGDAIPLSLAFTTDGKEILAVNNYQIIRRISSEDFKKMISIKCSKREYLLDFLAKTVEGCKILMSILINQTAGKRQPLEFIKNKLYLSTRQQESILTSVEPRCDLDIRFILLKNKSLVAHLRVYDGKNTALLQLIDNMPDIDQENFYNLVVRLLDPKYGEMNRRYLLTYINRNRSELTIMDGDEKRSITPEEKETRNTFNKLAKGVDNQVSFVNELFNLYFNGRKNKWRECIKKLFAVEKIIKTYGSMNPLYINMPKRITMRVLSELSHLNIPLTKKNVLTMLKNITDSKPYRKEVIQSLDAPKAPSSYADNDQAGRVLITVNKDPHSTKEHKQSRQTNGSEYNIKMYYATKKQYNDCKNFIAELLSSTSYIDRWSYFFSATKKNVLIKILQELEERETDKIKVESLVDSFKRIIQCVLLIRGIGRKTHSAMMALTLLNTNPDYDWLKRLVSHSTQEICYNHLTRYVNGNNISTATNVLNNNYNKKILNAP